MHHEDKAGLNTLLQRLDNLRLTRLPIAALFITNRPDALDPAVRRRAALDLHFERPGDGIRAHIILTSIPELKPGRTEIAELVRLTSTGDPGVSISNPAFCTLSKWPISLVYSCGFTSGLGERW